MNTQQNNAMIAANKAASAARKGPKKEPINNTDRVASFRDLGGRVLHLRPSALLRGTTIAYIDRGTRVEFATSVQHGADVFDKKTGTKVAIEHFFGGKTVVLPKSSKSRTGDVFKNFKWALG